MRKIMKKLLPLMNITNMQNYPARESMVLLKNEDISHYQRRKVLFTGPFTNHMRYQGSGSSLINPYKVDTIKDKVPEFSKNVTVTNGITLIVKISIVKLSN